MPARTRCFNLSMHPRHKQECSLVILLKTQFPTACLLFESLTKLHYNSRCQILPHGPDPVSGESIMHTAYVWHCCYFSSQFHQKVVLDSRFHTHHPSRLYTLILWAEMAAQSYFLIRLALKIAEAIVLNYKCHT